MEVRLFQKVVEELHSTGFTVMGLAASGEVTLHPQLSRFLELALKRGLVTEILTNGWLFKERLLPLLKNPRTRSAIVQIGFSVDGPNAQVHDANRRPGSFDRIMEAVALCRALKVPFYFKTTIRQANIKLLREMIELSTPLGVQQHRFIVPMPTPQMVRDSDLPTPAEISKALVQIRKWAKFSNDRVVPEAAAYARSALFACNAFSKFGVDAEGYLLLCSNLAYTVDERGRWQSGLERVAHLGRMSLIKAIPLHFERLAEALRWRMKASKFITRGDFSLCYWCFYQFGKLNWLRAYPNSPWAKGVLDAEAAGITPMLGTPADLL